MIGKKRKGWIGIDVGSHSVKLVQVERQGARVQLSEALVIRRPQAWSDSNSSEPPAAPSAEEIRAGVSLGNGFRGRDAAVTLSMHLCDIRGLSVPEADPVERRELVGQELVTVGAGDLSTREYDFWPITADSDHQLPENVLAASVSHDWSNQIAADLADSRLIGQVLDVMPTGLARALELAEPGISRQPVAAVDWGYQRATLCVVLDGCPVFVRCLRNSGFASVMEAVRRGLSLTGEESQKLLLEHGLPAGKAGENEELQAVIAEVAAQPLLNFAEELQRTLTFLEQQRRLFVPREIVLFGGGGAVRNVATYLSDKVDLPIRPWTLNCSAAVERIRPSLPMFGPAVAASALAWECT